MSILRYDKISINYIFEKEYRQSLVNITDKVCFDNFKHLFNCTTYSDVDLVRDEIVTKLVSIAYNDFFNDFEIKFKHVEFSLRENLFYMYLSTLAYEIILDNEDDIKDFIKDCVVDFIKEVAKSNDKYKCLLIEY